VQRELVEGDGVPDAPVAVEHPLAKASWRWPKTKSFVSVTPICSLACRK
jgi:hypothetical protein